MFPSGTIQKQRSASSANKVAYALHQRISEDIIWVFTFNSTVFFHSTTITATLRGIGYARFAIT